ncbi:hypothetical protein D3C73_1573480 [compost metagenome]
MSDFACRMSIKCRFHVLRLYPTAIIRHPNTLQAALFYPYVHSCTARINRILDQLLHDGGWTFHDLTGSNLIRNMLI